MNKSERKYIIYLVILFILIALSHTMSYEDEKAAESADPCPTCNGGLGCLTDSECEGIERMADNLPLSVRE